MATSKAPIELNRILAEPFDEAVQQATEVQKVGGMLDVINAANTAALARGVSALTERIGDRDRGPTGQPGPPGPKGDPGPEGPAGRDGSTSIFFVRGAEVRTAIGDDFVYRGHALAGTSENANGWYLERCRLDERGLVIETTGLSGLVAWADRERPELDEEWRLDRVKTVAARAALIKGVDFSGLVQAGLISAAAASSARRNLGDEKYINTRIDPPGVTL